MGANTAGVRSPGALHEEAARLRRELEERDDRLLQGKRELAAQARQLRRSQSERQEFQIQIGELRAQLHPEFCDDISQAAVAQFRRRRDSRGDARDDANEVNFLRDEKQALLGGLPRLRAETAAERADRYEDGSATASLVTELRGLRQAADATERERSRERSEVRNQRFEVGKLHSELAVSRRDVAAKNLNLVQLRGELEVAASVVASPSGVQTISAEEGSMLRIELQEARASSSVRLHQVSELEQRLADEAALLQMEKAELQADNSRLASDAAFLIDAMAVGREKQMQLEEDKLELQHSSIHENSENQRERERHAQMLSEAVANACAARENTSEAFEIADLRSQLAVVSGRAEITDLREELALTRALAPRQASSFSVDHALLSPTPGSSTLDMRSPLVGSPITPGSQAKASLFSEVVQLRAKLAAREGESECVSAASAAAAEAAAQAVISVSSVANYMRGELKGSEEAAEVRAAKHSAELALRDEAIAQLTKEACSLREATVIRDQLIEQLRQEVLSQAEHVRILKEAEQVYSKLQRRSAEKVEKLTEQKFSQRKDTLEALQEDRRVEPSTPFPVLAWEGLRSLKPLGANHVELK